MKMKKINIFLMLAGLLILASCGTHIDDLIIKRTDVDVDVEVDFKTLVLGYDSTLNVATADGLGEGAVYQWLIDSVSAESHEAVTVEPSGNTCTLDPAKLGIGKHTLLVIGTLDGVEYSAECTVTITGE